MATGVELDCIDRRAAPGGGTAHGTVKPIGTRRYLTRKIRKPQLRSRNERAPLDQRGRASLFVSPAGHEMTLLVEMIVDLSLN
jgi:hypothetical protein